MLCNYTILNHFQAFFPALKLIYFHSSTYWRTQMLILMYCNRPILANNIDKLIYVGQAWFKSDFRSYNHFLNVFVSGVLSHCLWCKPSLKLSKKHLVSHYRYNGNNIFYVFLTSDSVLHVNHWAVLEKETQQTADVCGCYCIYKMCNYKLMALIFSETFLCSVTSIMFIFGCFLLFEKTCIHGLSVV